MRIVSWNVNGLRACAKKGFNEWLATCEADIVAVQEVRARPEQLTDSVRAPEGWLAHFVSAEKKGYSGVGLYSRREPDAIEATLGVDEYDVEGRAQFVRYGNMTLANCYFPNGSGKNRDHSRVPYKIGFYQRLFDILEPERKAGRAILVAGDFNTAHKEIDLARPKANGKTSGFLPAEREEVERWIQAGWTDTFRVFEKGEGHYSWWSQRFGVRQKNIGWRIDMILASEAALPHLRGAAIHPEVMGSDHCPISVDVDEGILVE